MQRSLLEVRSQKEAMVVREKVQNYQYLAVSIVKLFILYDTAEYEYVCTFNQWGQCILFSVVFTPYPPQPPPLIGNHGSVWVLPVISLLLSNTVSPVRACLII